MKEDDQIRYGKIVLAPLKILTLYLFILGSLTIDFAELSSEVLGLNGVLVLLTVCLGHSVGLHRGIIHKSYQTSRWFRNLLAYAFVFTGLGGPLNWLKFHYYRDYWQNQSECLPYFGYKHSLLKDYWWNLHLSFRPTNIDRYNIPKDDLEDTWLRFLNGTWLAHILGMALLFYLLYGWNAMLFLVAFRAAVTTLAHWFIGYASHTHGYVRYEVSGASESGYNDVLLGVCSFGEGFHNNHHAYPKSAKFSKSWFELDLGWCAIVILKYIGLIWEVQTHRDAEARAKALKVYPITTTDILH